MDSTNQEYTKRKGFRFRNDILLIFTLLLIAAISLFIMKVQQKEGAIIVVTIDGQEYGRYSLAEEQEISIQGDDFVSSLSISHGKADMTEADCPDQICVKHKPVCHDGETIVCLPHKVVVTVESEEKDNIDIIAK
ncbi:MAG: NusG domain II-containing protein [Eubacteriales bacterium]|nr:NusG domain II-containing protein [Eubacteriales bacterium]